MQRSKDRGRARSLPIKICAVLFLAFWIVVPSQAENVRDSSSAGQELANPVVTPAVCQNIDYLVKKKLAGQHGAGYAIEVIENDKIVYQKCYGYANVGKRIPVTPETIFGLASITKTFTGIALLSLVDQGKIDLNKTIDTYLTDPSFRWKHITVFQLANMTSGLRRDLEVLLPWEDQYDMVKLQPLLYKPGTKHHYSNIGYRLLGQIIENVSGKSYLDYVREIVLTPAGMTSTGSVSNVASTGLLAVPYEATSNGLHQVTYRMATNNYAAGMLFSNLNDMAKYAQALLDRKFLSSNSYETMWFRRSTLPDGTLCYWAFGWINRLTESDKKHQVVSMNGELPGIAADIILFPESKVAIITLSNLNTTNNLVLANNVSQLIFP